MTDAQIHRGPDDEGYFEDLNGCLRLGHRRLSIIDLTSGHQPMSDVQGKGVIVYNGEIYNYKEIREELKSQNILFRTDSDTEVVLNAYLAWGKNCLNKFRGMFAFAVWDVERQMLFLARDHVGIKPLHYAVFDDKFLFSSELKGITSGAPSTPTLNREALGLYLRFGYIPAPGTIYDNYFKLRPGHYLEISVEEGFNIREYTYWEWDIGRKDVSSEDECIELLEKTLHESVKYHLVSDVPIGFFLSGGIDSSLVAAIAAQHVPRDVNTFSMGFREGEYSELEFAEKVSRHIGSNHHSQILDQDTMESALPRLVNIYDEPFGDSSALPTFYICKAISEKVKVALSGDGGDELWGGYTRYSTALEYQIDLEGLSGRLTRKTAKVLKYVWPFQWKSLSLRYFSCDAMERYVFGMEMYFKEDQIKRLLNGDFCIAATKGNYLEGVLKDCPGDADLLDAMQWLDLKSYLPEDCLTKVDRASMANSLEVRVPMLDQTMVQLAGRVKSTIRVRKNGDCSDKYLKYPLRKLVEKYIDSDIAFRRKKGFSAPINNWFRDDIGEKMIEERINENPGMKTILNESYIKTLIHEHKIGKKNHGRRLWSLLILLEWWKVNSPKY